MVHIGSTQTEYPKPTKLAIRTSDRKTFKDCRLQWDFSSPLRENKEPKYPGEALVFGTAVHKGWEVYYDPERRAQYDMPTLQKLAVAAMVAELKPFKDGYDLDTFDKYKVLGIDMLTYYFEWAPANDVSLVPLAVEMDFCIPIGYIRPTGSFCSFDNHMSIEERNETLLWENTELKPVVYEGRIDLVFKDTKTGKVWIVDHKTTSQFSDTFYLSIDTQVSAYAWAMDKLGFDVAGIIYNEQLKKVPSPPSELKSGRLSVAKNQGTTVELFLGELNMTLDDYVASGTGDDKYDEFVDYLINNPTDYVRRTPIGRNKQELAKQGEYILMETEEMLIDPNIYPTPNKMVCNYCAFRGPCLAEQEDRDSEIMLEMGDFDNRKPRNWR